MMIDRFGHVLYLSTACKYIQINVVMLKGGIETYILMNMHNQMIELSASSMHANFGKFTRLGTKIMSRCIMHVFEITVIVQFTTVLLVS